ncbi:MAG: pseudaminic acid cytidylyltransferase [Rhodocyclaceae bacterium]|nr:pseudaminic acid cytidylyltransferase [Rhodocyclaceae bacterium]MCL4757154.1 pseudaminic acid cytidylyltransferase [Rhodocyclaceae bacterium]
MKAVAVIPARGGSKRIPRKNIRLFDGIPLIAHSIRRAIASGCFERILVSTDDPEIAGHARREGAEVPFQRPSELADDHAGTGAVVCHALEWLANCGQLPELACCLYATSPLGRVEDLLRGRDALLAAPDRQFAFSVTTFAFPIQRALRLTAAGGVEPMYPEFIGRRSQDLEEAYHDAGQFYWGRSEAFLRGVPMFSDAAIPIILPRHRVQDIDTPEDWERAEYLYHALQLAHRDGGEGRAQEAGLDLGDARRDPR